MKKPEAKNLALLSLLGDVLRAFSLLSDVHN
jgi:hypothetical protein